jgi:hypothetical protein
VVHWMAFFYVQVGNKDIVITAPRNKPESCVKRPSNSQSTQGVNV